MKLDEAWRTAAQWGPFAVRTAMYGSISLTLGPVTPDRSASLWAMQRWCRSSARALRIDVRVEGLEHVPSSGPFVYVSNHQSLADILVLGSVLPHDYKWAAKRSLMKIPFLGWHLRLAGHVPVDRSAGSRAAAQVIARFEEVLRAGKPLLVFPEGTRSEDGVLKPFKNGGFYAAVRAGAPVVPVSLEGTHDLLKKGAASIGAGDADRVVRVKLGAPIAPLAAGRESARVSDLRDRTYAAIADQLRSLGGRVPEAQAPGATVSDPPPSADASVS